jgi:hypothetical protein
MKKVFVRFGTLLASQEMQAIGCNRVTHTSNTYLNAASAEKTSSQDWGKVLSKKLRVMKTTAGRT